MIFMSSLSVNLAGSMLLVRHSIGISEFFHASYYLLVIVLAAGLLLCTAIAFAACYFNNKKIKRESQKENEDAEQK